MLRFGGWEAVPMGSESVSKKKVVKGIRDSSVGGFLRWRKRNFVVMYLDFEYLNVSGPAFCFIWSIRGLKG